MRAVSDALVEFGLACEELQYVVSVAECKELIGRMTRIRQALSRTAVSRRVEKEIRELNRRLPTIVESERQRLQSLFNARKAELEEKAPRCERGHAMVIRSGPSSWFWGCGRYPFCKDSASLTVEQRRILESCQLRP